MPVKRSSARVSEQQCISAAPLQKGSPRLGRAAGLSATTTDPHERIVELEQENGELRRATRSCT